MDIRRGARPGPTQGIVPGLGGGAHIADARVASQSSRLSSTAKGSASINFDLGQDVASMMIAATDLGVGTRHASVHDCDAAAVTLAQREWPARCAFTRHSFLPGQGSSESANVTGSPTPGTRSRTTSHLRIMSKSPSSGRPADSQSVRPPAYRLTFAYPASSRAQYIATLAWQSGLVQ